MSENKPLLKGSDNQDTEINRSLNKEEILLSRQNAADQDRKNRWSSDSENEHDKFVLSQQKASNKKLGDVRKFSNDSSSLTNSEQTKYVSNSLKSNSITSHKDFDSLSGSNKKDQGSEKKLGPLSTYFSLLKGFIATGILYMPKNFKNAGWLWAIITMFLSFLITIVCNSKLVKIWLKHKVDFSELGFLSMGKSGKYMVDAFLTIMQIGFVISQTYFITSNLQSVMKGAFGLDISIIWFGLFCFLVTTPLSFIREVGKFSILYIIAVGLIFVTTIVITVFASIHLSDNGWGKGVQMFNEATWLSMVGSSIYAYEGVGTIIPILRRTEKPELSPKILFFVCATVFALYSSFATNCYFIYGDELTQPLITSNLPQGYLVYIIKVAFSINLVFTFPLTIYPANEIIEGYVFKRMGSSYERQFLKNICRTIVSFIGITACISIGQSVDKFISLSGTMTCTPVALMMPAIFHYKLGNPTKREKIVDIFIIVLAILIVIFCSAYTIWTWND